MREVKGNHVEDSSEIKVLVDPQLVVGPLAGTGPGRLGKYGSRPPVQEGHRLGAGTHQSWVVKAGVQQLGPVGGVIVGGQWSCGSRGEQKAGAKSLLLQVLQ
jgi:hypothetical protein